MIQKWLIINNGLRTLLKNQLSKMVNYYQTWLTINGYPLLKIKLTLWLLNLTAKPRIP